MILQLCDFDFYANLKQSRLGACSCMKLEHLVILSFLVLIDASKASICDNVHFSKNCK